VSFWSELRRRKVVRIGILYAIVGLGVGEGADVFLPQLGAPEWVVPVILALLVLGFPVALVLAWAYEVTPEGVVRDEGPSDGSVEATGTGDEVAAADKAAAAGGSTVGGAAFTGTPTHPGPGAPEDKSIAVLPFTDMSPEGDQEYFGDGIAEELINALVRLDGLHVAARTSTFALKGQGEDVREIGRKLGVATVLEGSIRKSGNRLRITAQLVEVERGYHLWSETYDRDLDDVFLIQDEITRSVVSELASELLGDPDQPIAAAPTESAEAYELYMRGRYFWYRRYLSPLQTALEYFQKAIDLDPDFALAYTGIADAYSILGFYHFMDVQEARSRAVAAAQRALELEPLLAQAHASVGFVKVTVDWSPDWSEITGPLQRAIDLNPAYGEARCWLGVAWALTGKPDQGVTETRAAVECDPHSTYATIIHALALMYARRYEEGLEVMKQALSVEPENAIALYGSSWLLALTGDTDGAVAATRRLVEHTGGPAAFRSMHALTLGVAKRTDEARAILSDLEARDGEDQTGAVWKLFAALGAAEWEKAVGYCVAAFEAREPFALMLFGLPLLDPIVSDPRVRAAIEASGVDPAALEQRIRNDDLSPARW